MYSQLRGTIIESELGKDALKIVIDVQGVGYEVWMPKACEGRLPKGPTILYVNESVTAYDGATTLYGFLTRDEKDFFMRIRENVGGMGPKKALECIDKVSKSLPDFKRAILESDVRLLVSVFGFTKKTAEKLVFSLKGKADDWKVTGAVKWGAAATTGIEADALSGLLNLGYREEEARDAINRAKTKIGTKAKTEDYLQEALRQLAARLS